MYKKIRQKISHKTLKPCRKEENPLKERSSTMSSAPSNPRPQPPPPKRDPLYDCGGCGEEVPLRPGDKIECPHCNYPVLFKKRTRRIVEFQAR